MSAVEEAEVAFLWRDEEVKPEPKRKHITVLPNGAEVRLFQSDYSNKWFCIIYPATNRTDIYICGSDVTPAGAIRDAEEKIPSLIAAANKVKDTAESYRESLIASVANW